MGKAPAHQPVIRDERRLLQAAAVSGALALLLTFYVAWHGTPLPGDVDIARWVQDRSLANRFEGPINLLGIFPVQLAVGVACMVLAAFAPRLRLASAAASERMYAVWALIAALILRSASTPLKSMAQADRPSAGYDLHIAREFSGFGFPSGHVLSDVVIYGTIAVIAPAILGRAAGAAARVFCLAIILLAGPSRVAVGAHWPGDVLGGYLWGFAGLCLALAFASRFAQR
ncbi:MAG: phosphatase PAP2 family protein [Dehalococcoidia bacterium]